MNRFLRTAYSTIYVYLFLTLFMVTVTGADMPFPAFLFLFFGLMVALLPEIYESLPGNRTLWASLGLLLALPGFWAVRFSQGSLLHYILYGLGLLAGMIFLHLRRYPISYLRFRDAFRRSVLAAAVLILYDLLVIAPAVLDKKLFSFSFERFIGAVDNLAPLIILLLVVGVLHLRGLRSEQIGMERKALRRRQLRDLLLFVTVVIIVYIFNPLVYIIKGGKHLWNKGLLPLLTWISGALSSLFSSLFSFQRPPTDNIIKETLDYNSSLPGGDLPPGEMVPTEAVEEVVSEGIDLYMLLVGIWLTVSLCILLYFLIFKKRTVKRKTNLGYPNETVEMLEEEEEEEQAPLPKKRSADPRLRIRYQYQSFLKYLRKISVQVKHTDTSGEIGESAKEGIRAEAESIDAFTEIYNRARYQQNEEVSAADAESMKRLLEDMKGKK